jgi:hypothetical protein
MKGKLRVGGLLEVGMVAYFAFFFSALTLNFDKWYFGFVSIIFVVDGTAYWTAFPFREH